MTSVAPVLFWLTITVWRTPTLNAYICNEALEVLRLDPDKL